MTTNPTSDPNDVDLNENIPDNFLVKYDRFAIIFWTIASGWIDLGVSFSMVGTTILSGLSQYNSFDENLRNKMGLATVIIASVSTGLHILKSIANQTIEKRRESLQQLIIEYDKRHKKSDTI